MIEGGIGDHHIVAHDIVVKFDPVLITRAFILARNAAIVQGKVVGRGIDVDAVIIRGINGDPGQDRRLGYVGVDCPDERNADITVILARTVVGLILVDRNVRHDQPVDRGFKPDHLVARIAVKIVKGGIGYGDIGGHPVKTDPIHLRIVHGEAVDKNVGGRTLEQYAVVAVIAAAGQVEIQVAVPDGHIIGGAVDLDAP